MKQTELMKQTHCKASRDYKANKLDYNELTIPVYINHSVLNMILKYSIALLQTWF